MYEGVRKQMAWLAKHENKQGILTNMPGWSFVDWTMLDDSKSDGAVQGWYLEALEYSAKLAREAGDAKGAAAYLRKAAVLRKSLAREYWSDKRKAFLRYRKDSDKRPAGVPADLIGQHENFLFSLLGVGTAAQRKQALDAMRGATGRYLPNFGDYQSSYLPDGQHGCALGADGVIRLGTPFWSYYALLALMESNRTNEAIEYIRLCWGLMLEHGATSCWEMWDRHTSLCHGWSAAPAMILPAYVLGVSPLRPGFKRFAVRPRPGDLAWAKGRVPTTHGIIKASWKIQDGKFILNLNVPKETSAQVSPPVDGSDGGGARWRLAKVNGKSCTGREKVVLDPGVHEVVFTHGS
jgi:alpha-L-rhamnosidase